MIQVCSKTSRATPARAGRLVVHIWLPSSQLFLGTFRRSISPKLIGASLFLVTLELVSGVISAVHPVQLLDTLVGIIYLALHIGLSIRFYRDGFVYRRTLSDAVYLSSRTDNIGDDASENVFIAARRRAGQTLLVIGLGNTLVTLRYMASGV